MLKIDCLLQNTELVADAKRLISHWASKRLKDGRDVPFDHIFHELRENGIEMDLESAAKLYEDTLPTENKEFTSSEDLQYRTGQWLDKQIRNITLQPAKEGEKEIGELSPAQAVVKGISDLFANNVIKDNTTKSILKQIEDASMTGMKRLLGELPNEIKKEDKRTLPELVQSALDKESLGYTNLTYGTINGVHKVFDEVRRVIGELTQHMRNDGDEHSAAQWEAYVDNIEHASYSLLFSTAEGQQALHDSLKEGGFVKELKSGEKVLDWAKLMNETNSIRMLHENVVGGLMDNGFSKEVSERVAETLQKEFGDMRTKLIEKADAQRERRADTWDKIESPATSSASAKDLVASRFKENKAQSELAQEGKDLVFSKHEGEYILSQAVKAHEKYGKGESDKRDIDWQALKSNNADADTLKIIVEDYLLNNGFDQQSTRAAEEAISGANKAMYNQFVGDIDIHAERLLDIAEKGLERKTAERKSRLSRLAELNDLGIFKGAHEKLLNNILGIDHSDQETMDGVKKYADQLSKLRQLMSGNEQTFAPQLQREINRDIHNLLSKNVTHKGMLLKIASALNKYYQVENSLMIATHAGIMENHLSALTELASQYASIRMDIGSLAKLGAEDWSLIKDTYSHIAAGGVEFGLAPYQVGGKQSRVSDNLTVHNLRGADWTKPATWGRAVATGLLTVPRAFLSGADGAAKVTLFRLHFLQGMVHSLVNTGKYTKEQAIQFVSESIKGKDVMDVARVQAEDLYKMVGRDITSKKEINIAANNIVLENLLLHDSIGQEVDAKTLAQVKESAFHQAGLGLGHESNNWMSKQIESGKKSMQKLEDQALRDGDFKAAGSYRLMNTVINGAIMRFAASRFNWGWIKVQQTGYGLISGILHSNGLSKELIKAQDMMDYEKVAAIQKKQLAARAMIARGVGGMALSMGYLGYKWINNAFTPDEKDKDRTFYEQIKDSPEKKKMFIKTAPLLALLDYYYSLSKSDDPAAKFGYGVGQVFSATSNVGDNNDMSLKVAEITKGFNSEDYDTREKAWGKLGKLTGQYVGGVPMWGEVGNVTRAVHYFKNGVQDKYPEDPMGFLEGFLFQSASEAAYNAVFDKEQKQVKELQTW